MILPADWVHEFAAFCAANPKPCPLIARGEPGETALPTLGDIDVRSDLPRYRVFRDGGRSEETDITALWRDDLVAFALGCSYSFEAALLDAGVPIRHIEQGKKVCTYRPPRHRAGRAPAWPHGGVDAQLHRAQRNPRYRDLLALPASARRADPLRRARGDRHRRHRQPSSGQPDIRPGEVPLFWACGVTPQAVIEAARPPFCITHKAGHMLVTDRLNEEFREADASSQPRCSAPVPRLRTRLVSLKPARWPGTRALR